METKKIPFFIRLKNAIVNFDEYKTFSEEKVSVAIKYILKLTLIFTFIIAIALRFIPGLVEETDKIMMAQKARGANLDSGNLFKKIKAMLPVLIPLVVSAFRRADELADALDARCYNASTTRTKMKVFKIKASDIVMFVGFSAVMTAILLDKYYVGTFVTPPDLNGFEVQGLDIFIYNIFNKIGR